VISELPLCTCPPTASLPRIDATAIDHDIRHAAIFGALAGSARGIELVAPHDPIRLLHQIEDRWPGGFKVDYLERDTAWRLAITPIAAA
jgi:uncharacterized protein (DUF2249 family)